MCSSEASFSLSFHSNPRIVCPRLLNSCFSANPFFIRPRKCSPFSVSASIAAKNSSREISWISWDRVAVDEYNGWEVGDSAQKPVMKKSKCLIFAIAVNPCEIYCVRVGRIGANCEMNSAGLPKVLTVGIGASFVGLLAYFSLASYGPRMRSPFHALHGFKLPFLTSEHDIASEEVTSDGKMEDDAHLPEDHANRVSSDSVTGAATTRQKLDRILVPFTVDSVQQEALSVLKKFKIIEDDARADELCTRREYARWFVRANSQLERSRKHQVIPSAALSGSSIIAFDDVSSQDPDFEYIQFQMSRKNIGFIDVKAISSDSLSELFVDFLAKEKGILREVFGQCRRLQPNKPCTKGQAAVALSCGRLSEFIRAEISRLEVETITRQQEMEETVSELLERGEIKEFWERKKEEERSRGVEVEQDYHTSVTGLEQEKAFQENSLAEFLKQQAALDCQKQLLSTINSEVTEMSERFKAERLKHLDEQNNVQKALHDLETQYEALLDAKSVLEAEVEALEY
ncbi:hypothetical protein F511_36864 [Dorcoceras hygrometricum]|uniref:Uncharacterized protein n=1 Tax=Dorcoceras hygrometricum TaxID=472368 RepID=A0A2Z7BUI9_9LAMI|nr:hypothetical protein F511_36864 [Dorcoceras hygrometricum]